MNSTVTSGTHFHDWSSPIGDLRLLRTGPDLRAIWFRDAKHCREPKGTWHEGPDGFEAVKDQLEGFLRGDRQAFELPLRIEGTPFQEQVWAELLRIPVGSTASYADLARRVGRPSAVRAVAAANARNPLSIVVPCHRVIGSDGSLTGYAGGLDRKRRLLALEGALPERDQARR